MAAWSKVTCRSTQLYKSDRDGEPSQCMGPRKISNIYKLLDSVQQLHVQQPSTYEKPEAARAVSGSWLWAVCRPKHVELYINRE
jgi:hypothetical protein